jgi:pimeloyl-ACP methyl ester carboxylesterase
MRSYPRNRLTDRSGARPVVTKTARSRGYAISYEDAGAGPAVVLIPGWTMSAADWRDAGYTDLLATSRRVLAVDPLGNGLSDRPHDTDAYGWPAVAADVIASWTLRASIGQSYGATRVARGSRPRSPPSSRIGWPPSS